ncbi:Cell wall-associated polypeptide CWBP200 [Chryseobacterium carnipullorum]|nr:Cell wall-associated polypeptide CWBP200 [Chryseobacterium carnipullorum]
MLLFFLYRSTIITYNYIIEMKFILSFILSLCSVLGFSQTILYQAENTSRTVQDPQTVVLAQGFHATSNVSNPFVAKIGPNTGNPGGGPVDSNAGTNNPSGTSVSGDQKFHDTKGNIEVTGAGQLQFALPIALPPGVKSVSPNISLIYLSNSGNGIAGYGWTISGVTTISRIGKNIEKDGELSSIKLDYSDYYSFNGQRLILKDGEYGKDGAEYVTEKYSNVKIKSVGSVVGQLWKGPAYWEITFEDGSQAWYGDTTIGNNEARTPVEYNIVKWRDTQGNYILYSYAQTTSNNVANVSSIKWGGNDTLNTPTINEITFSYIPRNLSELSYINGLSLIQDKILDHVIVTSGNNTYRKYTIDYTNNGTSYQFANKITEYNANNEPANPVTINYPNMVSSSHEEYIAEPDPFNNVKLVGDFNGDSYLDFVMNNGIVKLGAFNETFSNISTNKIFSNKAKVVNTLLDEEGQIYNGNGIVQYEEGKIVGYIFRNNIFVKVFEKLVYNESNCVTGNEPPPAGCYIEQLSLNEGDLNGDGISDIFLTLKKRVCEWTPDPACSNITPNETTNRPAPCTVLRCATYDIGNFIVDLKNQNNPVATYTIDTGINESVLYNQQYTDVDGDGKVDIINISNTAYTVFEFVKTAPNQYLKKVRLAGNLAETKDPEFPVLYGDFNGDGKLDFTIPVAEKSVGVEDWRFYIGTGKDFKPQLKQNFFGYKKRQTQITNNYNKYTKQYFLSVTDMNKDGKSDIVQVFSYNQINQLSAQGYRNFGYIVSAKMANGSASDGTLNFTSNWIFQSPDYEVQDINDTTLFTPLTNPIKSGNNYYNVFLYWKQYLKKIKGPTPVSELARISSISQGGVTTSANYLEIVPENIINPNFYKKIKKEFYPYFSLNRVDQTYAVSQLLQAGRKQDFRYRGMTAHLQGRGTIGYHQMARSSWYADGMENTKIWSGIETDSQKFGLPSKEWSIRTNDESLIFPVDISVNNQQLLSFKQNDYSVQQLSGGIDVVLPQSIIEKDFLKNITLTKSVTYNNYYLPTSTQLNINNNFSTVNTTFEYIHNPAGISSNYYIGRPKSKTVVTQAYSDTTSAKEEYVYESNLLKTLKTWNRDNTEYLQETYNYDSFGNIIQKVISNSVDSQTQTSISKYESTGRFVEKNTDNLGLAISYTYNDKGQILTQTDPLDNKLTNTYDTWGKLMKSKTNLEGTTTYQYEKDSQSNITITQYDPDGDVSKKYTNKLGQEYKTSTKAFGQGQFVSQETQYDVLGRKTKESEPYFEGGNISLWNVIAYNDTFYPAKVTATALATLNNAGEISSFLGKRIETITSGNTISVTEVNGYARTNSKTADALNNVISSTDKGGTVNFSYNAAGEQIKAQYAENIVTTKYDSWGRKSEFNDPSNGLYKYEYDPFGQSKKIISPKGTKQYTYNNLGQLISHTEISTTDGGQATNKIISYSYDNKGRVVSKAGTSKGKSHSSNVAYDPQGRLLSSSESSNGKYFIRKGITYDDKGRVISYEKQLYSSGILTKVQVENVYSAWNGELYQVKDKNSGKVLWELKETNVKGQVVRAKLGASDINNTYNDATGFLTEIKHISPLQSILNIQYTFNVIKNELKLRKTLGDFNIIESFDYDDNNRLISWTNPRTGQNSQNSYDTKGRIIENDQVGTMKYENSTKIYQSTGMTLNAAGTQNYNNDLIQSIAYNENNDPVFIDGEKGDVAFQYGLTSMRQKVSYGGNFDPDQEGKFTKFYSEDGSFEIVKDNTTGKEKHVLYIGGSPYESSIIYLKNYDETGGSYKFLHKDYIGSILAISDEAGNKLEQRHFDAWGNFTHLQIGNGAIITDKNTIDTTSLLIERGYTSHEHFAEVGIIHMNGRLYDPLLRRFLNADENIQDPTNTQNYNKYGYVMNNPLMFNDPNGECFVPLFGVLVASWVAGAVVGTMVAAGMYILKSLVNGTWSWGGFAKSLLLGAVTGAATGGLTGGMSASGFNGAVIVGSMNGAIAGGIDAVFNKQNFFTGLYKGAVMGAAIGGIGYAINYFASGSYKTKYFSRDSVTNSDDFTYDTSVSKETMQENINTMRSDNFTKEEIREFGVGTDQLATKNVDLGGYLNPGNGQQYAYTTPKNFITGNSDIVYAPITAQNKPLLAITMVHETGHAYANKLSLMDIGIDTKELKINPNLDSTEHIALYKLEHIYGDRNLMLNRPTSMFIRQSRINSAYSKMNSVQKSLIDNTFNKIHPVFNRFMLIR